MHPRDSLTDMGVGPLWLDMDPYYYSHIFREFEHGRVVWEWYWKGVPLLGVPENPTDWSFTASLPKRNGTGPEAGSSFSWDHFSELLNFGIFCNFLGWVGEIGPLRRWVGKWPNFEKSNRNCQQKLVTHPWQAVLDVFFFWVIFDLFTSGLVVPWDEKSPSRSHHLGEDFLELFRSILSKSK